MGAVENLEARRAEFDKMIHDPATPEKARYGLCLAHNNIAEVIEKLTGTTLKKKDCDQYKPGP